MVFLRYGCEDACLRVPFKETLLHTKQCESSFPSPSLLSSPYKLFILSLLSSPYKLFIAKLKSAEYF